MGTRGASPRARRLARISEVPRRKLPLGFLKGFEVKTFSVRSGLVGGALLMLTSAALASAKTSSIAPRSDAMTALCRVKAKESANLAFKSCMSEGKSAEIESIRRDYQERLAAIKAEYEKELGRVSGVQKTETVKAEASKAEEAPATEESTPVDSDSEEASELMKNAILNDKTDEIQPRDRLMRRAQTQETASRNQIEKREPRESESQSPRTKRVQKVSKQIYASTQTKAILFNDGMEIPEPIPVEAMTSIEGAHQ